MASPSRILILHHTSLREGFGGIEYYLDDFVNHARCVLGPVNVHSVYPSFCAKDLPIFSSSETTWISLSSNPWLAKLQRRLSIRWFSNACVAIERFKPNYLICSHIQLAPFAFVLHQKFKIPFITMAYGIDVWGNQTLLQDQAFRRSHHIFTISEWTKSTLVSKGITPERVSIIHPGFLREWENLPFYEKDLTQPITLLTVGRIESRERYKGHEDTLEALCELRRQGLTIPYRYRIQGSGSDLVRLKNLVRTMQLQNQVEFQGSVTDRENLKQSYQTADLYVMPSRFEQKRGHSKGEGFGIAYVEAAALRTPSLAYAVGGATDIIRHQKTGWLTPPNQILALAQQLAELFQDRKQIYSVGERAYERINRLFCSSAIQAQVALAFESAGIRSTDRISECRPSTDAIHIAKPLGL